MIPVSTSDASNHRTARSPRSRRGVAMFLVIMALGVGVVLSGVMLTRQESTPMLAQNALEASESAWVASAAAELAEAMIQSQEDWLTATADQGLLEGFTIANGTVDVKVLNLKGAAPTGKDRELKLIITARVGAMTTTIERRVSMVMPTPAENIVDPHLREFAIFAKDRLRIESGAMVKEWDASPECGSLFPVKIGTGFSGASNMEFFSGAETVGVKLYRDATAGSTLDSFDDDDEFEDVESLPLVIPALPENLPGTFGTLLVANPLNRTLSLSGGSVTLVPGRHQNLTVRNNSRAVLDGSATPATFAFADLVVSDRGSLAIRGSVRIHVSGNMLVSNRGSIELVGDDARLELYVNNGMTVADAGVGVERAVAMDTARDPDAITTYRSPDALRIIAVSPASGGSASPNISLSAMSIALASIHAPQANICVSDGATLIGRATASRMELRSGTRLYYDPALDARTGYTEMQGPLYDDDSTPLPAVVSALSAVTATSDPVTVSASVRAAMNTSNWMVMTGAGGTGGVSPLDISVDDELLDGDDTGVNNTLTSNTPTTTAPASLRHNRRAVARPIPTRAMELED